MLIDSFHAFENYNKIYFHIIITSFSYYLLHLLMCRSRLYWFAQLHSEFGTNRRSNRFLLLFSSRCVERPRYQGSYCVLKMYDAENFHDWTDVGRWVSHISFLYFIGNERGVGRCWLVCAFLLSSQVIVDSFHILVRERGGSFFLSSRLNHVAVLSIDQ